MSAETESTYQPFSNDAGRPAWRGCGRGSRWTPVEIVAMVLGFILFWPIGLAIIGWKLWQKNSGYQGDIVSYAQEKWDRHSRCSPAVYESGDAWRSRWWGVSRTAAMGSTGNTAFDDWRTSELARLEEERNKLVQAEREFGAYIDSLRRAKDREEFDRFMEQRNSGQRNGAGPG